MREATSYKLQEESSQLLAISCELREERVVGYTLYAVRGDVRGER